MSKPYFPMFVDISQKNILVVGGGRIAARRVKTLLMFCERITIVAPVICEALQRLGADGAIEFIRREWEEADVNGFDIVLAVTDNREVNHLIGRTCRESSILVNLADDKSECDFFFPGVVSADDIVVGVSSGGSNPAKVKGVCRELKGVLEKRSCGKERLHGE